MENRSRFGGRPGEPDKIYTISANGGPPQLLLPDEALPHYEPNWSPDGNTLVFEKALPNGTRMLEFLDMQTNRVTPVPGLTTTLRRAGLQTDDIPSL